MIKDSMVFSGRKDMDKMKAEAIIFDKDGTLLDFDAFWVTVSHKAIQEVLEQFGYKSLSACEILEAFGVRDGVTDMNGVLCKGTYEQLGEILYGIFRQHGGSESCDDVTAALIEAYNRNAEAGEVRPTCPDLVRVLGDLKAQNIKLAVVTTDNLHITRQCLEKLGILDLFDRIYTDDGQTPTKPDPYCALDFCAFAHVEKEHVVMVGDTVTDMRFAKNAGIVSIGIAKNEQNRQILAPHATAVITDPSRIFDVLN